MLLRVGKILQRGEGQNAVCIHLNAKGLIHELLHAHSVERIQCEIGLKMVCGANKVEVLFLVGGDDGCAWNYPYLVVISHVLVFDGGVVVWWNKKGGRHIQQMLL